MDSVLRWRLCNAASGDLYRASPWRQPVRRPPRYSRQALRSIMDSQPTPLNVPTGLADHLRGASRTFVQSLLSVLGKAGDSDERKLEAVRAEVLRQLEACGPDGADLHLRVRHCTDLEEMWYLRPQLN